MNRYIPPVDVAVVCVDDAVALGELLLSSRKKKATRKSVLFILILAYYNQGTHNTILSSGYLCLETTVGNTAESSPSQSRWFLSLCKMLPDLSTARTQLTLYAQQCPNGLHLILYTSSVCCLPLLCHVLFCLLQNSHTVTNFLNLLMHYEGRQLFIFIPLFQFHFPSLDLFFHFVASLLQTGMILGIYCSQVGADRYSEKHLTAYLSSLHKKVPRMYQFPDIKCNPVLVVLPFSPLFHFSFSCSLFLVPPFSL